MKGLPQYLVLFDGECNLCEGTVQFLIKRDKKRRLRYASLQSDIGQKVLWHNNLATENFKSFLLVDHGKVYTRSTGALRVAILLGGFWSIMGVFLVVPSFIRNWVYDYIATNRYKWFGKKEECWIPTPELQELFLS